MANPPSVGVHKGVKALQIPLYVVEYTDRDGEKATKLAVLIGEEVRFLNNDALTAPVQTGLATSILIAAGMKDPHVKQQ